MSVCVGTRKTIITGDASHFDRFNYGNPLDGDACTNKNSSKRNSCNVLGIYSQHLLRQVLLHTDDVNVSYTRIYILFKYIYKVCIDFKMTIAFFIYIKFSLLCKYIFPPSSYSPLIHSFLLNRKNRRCQSIER